jgi:hypothetical protein
LFDEGKTYSFEVREDPTAVNDQFVCTLAKFQCSQVSPFCMAFAAAALCLGDFDARPAGCGGELVHFPGLPIDSDVNRPRIASGIFVGGARWQIGVGTTPVCIDGDNDCSVLRGSLECDRTLVSHAYVAAADLKVFAAGENGGIRYPRASLYFRRT